MANPNKIHKAVKWGSVALLGFAASFAIIAYTPLSGLIPGYPTAQVRDQQVRTALLIDSLERSIQRWELYTENLHRITLGEAPLQIDTLIRHMEDGDAASGADDLSAVDSVLRATVDMAEKFEISDHNKRNLEIEGLHFYKPLTGYVLEAYSAVHPYVLITAREGSRVTSVLDGSVIFTSWSEKDLWTIVVQHESGIISIYKNNQKLLKNANDRVGAGTSIALLGGSEATHTESPALHFELWQNGVSIDPAAYINL